MVFLGFKGICLTPPLSFLPPRHFLSISTSIYVRVQLFALSLAFHCLFICSYWAFKIAICCTLCFFDNRSHFQAFAYIFFSYYLITWTKFATCILFFQPIVKVSRASRTFHCLQMLIDLFVFGFLWNHFFNAKSSYAKH